MSAASSKLDVLYVISHGFSARMILHSDVIPELKKRGLSVGVITPDAREPSMIDLAARLGIAAEPPPAEPSRLQRLVVGRMQRYFFEDIEKNPALWAKHVRERETRSRLAGLSPALLLQLNRAARRFERIPRTVDGMQRRLLESEPVAACLRRLAPTLVVSTYPVNFVEAAFTHEAGRAGIATVGHLLSWDNITCKGRFPAPARYYVSWGPIMSGELGETYGIPTSDVYECGVPHFDSHVRGRDRTYTAQIVKDLGLDPARPYLFFGMSSPYFAPHEIDVVEWLAAEVQKNRWGEDVQLVVRPHPQNVTGNMADASWLPRLEALVGPRVAVDYPRLQKSRLLWNMQEGDLPRLANLIAGCAICLNSGSTLAIDAIIHDKPVILTCFDAGFELPWWRSARRVLDYRHIAKMVALGGVRVCGSSAELAAAVSDYLDDPGRDSDGRGRTRERECGACDGRASARVADALADLVARVSGKNAGRTTG